MVIFLIRILYSLYYFPFFQPSYHLYVFLLLFLYFFFFFFFSSTRCPSLSLSPFFYLIPVPFLFYLLPHLDEVVSSHSLFFLQCSLSVLLFFTWLQCSLAALSSLAPIFNAVLWWWVWYGYFAWWVYGGLWWCWFTRSMIFFFWRWVYQSWWCVVQRWWSGVARVSFFALIFCYGYCG